MTFFFYDAAELLAPFQGVEGIYEYDAFICLNKDGIAVTNGTCKPDAFYYLCYGRDRMGLSVKILKLKISIFLKHVYLLSVKIRE